MFINLKQSLVVWIIKTIQRYGPHKVQVLGRTYEICEEVFNPKFYYTSEFMARHINVSPDDVVLDMGTGSGIQAITAGQRASKVIAIDINPRAVEFARRNVKINGLENIVSVIAGDLFAPLKQEQMFNVILFTPPYLEGKPKSDLEYALFDPDKILINRFFREARKYLKPDGYVQMVYSSLANPEKVLGISKQHGWHYTMIARERTFSEAFLIYRLTLN
jgi:release factor glutamine methyltransferase